MMFWIVCSLPLDSYKRTKWNSSWKGGSPILSLYLLEQNSWSERKDTWPLKSLLITWEREQQNDVYSESPTRMSRM